MPDPQNAGRLARTRIGPLLGAHGSAHEAELLSASGGSHSAGLTTCLRRGHSGSGLAKIAACGGGGCAGNLPACRHPRASPSRPAAGPPPLHHGPNMRRAAGAAPRPARYHTGGTTADGQAEVLCGGVTGVVERSVQVWPSKTRWVPHTLTRFPYTSLSSTVLPFTQKPQSRYISAFVPVWRSEGGRAR
jgi:hypothetical protein